MANLAVLASGTGTNFVALYDTVIHTSHSLACLVCNVSGAPVLQKAAIRDVPTHLLSYGQGSRKQVEEEIASALEGHAVDIVALAGFMKILGHTFVSRYRGRIVNVHPSLLPRHPGRNAIQRSWMSDDPQLGVTVHLVDEGVDTGPVLAQEGFAREEVTDMDEAERRIHAIEHRLFPSVVLQLLDASTKPQRSTI